AEYSPIKLTFAYEARKISEADFATTHNQIVDEPAGELITSGATKHMWVNQDFKSTRLQRSAPDLYQVIEEFGERKSNNHSPYYSIGYLTVRQLKNAIQLPDLKSTLQYS